jgi:hypothetical protein
VAVFGAGFSLIFTAFMDLGTGGGAYLIGLIGLIGLIADRAGFGAAYGFPAVLCLAGAILLVRLARQPVISGAGG